MDLDQAKSTPLSLASEGADIPGGFGVQMRNVESLLVLRTELSQGTKLFLHGLSLIAVARNPFSSTGHVGR